MRCHERIHANTKVFLSHTAFKLIFIRVRIDHKGGGGGGGGVIKAIPHSTTAFIKLKLEITG